MQYSKFKRLTDVFVAGFALAVTSPVLAVVAGIVKWRVGSPVLFRQLRPGLHGKSFEILKFRTMTDARDDAGKLLPDDQRMTRTGSLLRSTSLDELPELWNVLVGDMSLVGPRPLLEKYLALYTPDQARRHEVRPGITGLAQVSGRNSLNWDDRLRLDVEYVDSCSALLDAKIVLRTISAVLGRKGIAEEGSVTMSEFRGQFT